MERVMRIRLAESAKPRIMAGRRNCDRLASGSRSKGVKRMGGTHFQQMEADHNDDGGQPESWHGQPTNGDGAKQVIQPTILLDAE